MIVVIDNYDSFTFNLVQQLQRLSRDEVAVRRNDAFDPPSLIAEAPDAIVISPGPGTPARAGRTLDLIRLNRAIPLLGVCLGHQALGQAFGASVVRGPVPVHGKVEAIHHEGKRLFAGCPAPMKATRYHSLIVDRETLPAHFNVDAETADGLIMAMSHRGLPLYGIQFHPESFGTEEGDRLIRNFLEVRR